MITQRDVFYKSNCIIYLCTIPKYIRPTFADSLQKLRFFKNFLIYFFLSCFVFLLCLEYIRATFATSLHRQAAGPEFAFRFFLI